MHDEQYFFDERNRKTLTNNSAVLQYTKTSNNSAKRVFAKQAESKCKRFLVFCIVDLFLKSQSIIDSTKCI